MNIEVAIIAIALAVGMISVVSTMIALFQRHQQSKEGRESDIRIDIGGHTKSISELTSEERDRVIRDLEQIQHAS